MAHVTHMRIMWGQKTIMPLLHIVIAPPRHTATATVIKKNKMLEFSGKKKKGQFRMYYVDIYHETKSE